MLTCNVERMAGEGKRGCGRLEIDVVVRKIGHRVASRVEHAENFERLCVIPKIQDVAFERGAPDILCEIGTRRA